MLHSMCNAAVLYHRGTLRIAFKNLFWALCSFNLCDWAQFDQMGEAYVIIGLTHALYNSILFSKFNFDFLLRKLYRILNSFSHFTVTFSVWYPYVSRLSSISPRYLVWFFQGISQSLIVSLKTYYWLKATKNTHTQTKQTNKIRLTLPSPKQLPELLILLKSPFFRPTDELCRMTKEIFFCFSLSMQQRTVYGWRRFAKRRDPFITTGCSGADRMEGKERQKSVL